MSDYRDPTIAMKHCPHCDMLSPFAAFQCQSCQRLFPSRELLEKRAALSRTAMKSPPPLVNPPPLSQPPTPVYQEMPGAPPVMAVPLIINQQGYVQQGYVQQGYVQQGYVQQGYIQPVYVVQYQHPVPAYRPGYIQKYPGSHSSGAAVLLSLLFTGAGQMFNGQVAKGVCLTLSTMILSICTGFLALLIIWPLAAIDANAVANRLNRGEQVATWQWF